MKYTHKNTCIGEEQNKLKNDKTVREEPKPLPRPETITDIEEVPIKQPQLVRPVKNIQSVITPDMMRDHRKQMIIDLINLRQDKMKNLFANSIKINKNKNKNIYKYIAIMSKGLTQRSNYDTSRNVFSESRVIDNRLQEYMNTSILQLEHNINILKGKQARVGLVSLRNNWKIKQDKLNYQSEYDRIRGLLEESVLEGKSVPHFENMVKTLQNMNVGVRPSDKFDNLY